MHPDFDVLRPGDPRPEVGAALRAWLDLQRALALRPQIAKEILQRTRDPRAALRLAGAAPAPAARLEAGVAALRRVDAVAVPFGSGAYPERLAVLSDAAPLLLVRGDVAALAGPCVAVVGARAASAYGRAVARRFAAELAAAGLVIVSGLALGIDAIAHDAALEAGGRTVAVQACGPERVYPARHRALAERICDERSGRDRVRSGNRAAGGLLPAAQSPDQRPLPGRAGGGGARAERLAHHRRPRGPAGGRRLRGAGADPRTDQRRHQPPALPGGRRGARRRR